MKRIPLVTLSLASLALFAGASPALANALEFSRDAFSRGELWRLFTAHLTHFDAAHLRWDVFALVLLGSMAEWKSRRDWIVTLALSAPLITLAVRLVQPQFEMYRGLSGLDCAAYGVVAAHLLRDGWIERHAPMLVLGALACAGVLAKCGYELFTGEPFFVGATETFTPVPLAHFAGALCGMAAVLCSAGRRPACALERQIRLRTPGRIEYPPRCKTPSRIISENPSCRWVRAGRTRA